MAKSQAFVWGAKLEGTYEALYLEFSEGVKLGCKQNNLMH